ncbi:hypothetical protein H8744_17995 [Oscillospiraceae bacterium N12]|jgi:hypothetical protein|uniref:PDZ domain-containing protein n=1 Tax=Jilunia laotingensis TaxID=2763675 RepID=A0A926FB44_9BACT|nr:S41 family peptidase [Jilunia laotingensis]MBC8595105.1 hypothetical protein [Jilunia laotingensis]
MKIRNILLIPSLLILLFSGISSCGVDRWPEYASETKLDLWIDSVMKQEYLWYKEMPSVPLGGKYFEAPGTFLKSLLYAEKDKSYSYIDTIRNTPVPSYGFNYTTHRSANADTLYEALVTYVLPHSPASIAGLERGDWIVKVNDELITKKNEKELFESGQAMKLSLGKYEIKKVETGEGDDKKVVEKGIVTETGEIINVGPEEVVEDNPVHYSEIITTATGAKAGYLVYSHFTSGTATDKEKYNSELRKISKEFADAGITYFILDLRYNTGGSLECAQLLSTLMAPSNALGTPFAYLEYNDKQTAKNKELLFDPELIGSTGKNMNLSYGFIISSSTTSGMAGIMLNCIVPHGKYVLIGSNVACPGVTTEAFISPERTWALNPVVCTVYNSEDESGEGGSFTAGYTANESEDLTKFLPFGNKDEALLSIAIGLIDGTYPPKDDEKPKTKMSPIKSINKAHPDKVRNGTRLK